MMPAVRSETDGPGGRPAGSVKIGAVANRQRLRELATLRPEGHKVLSLYLNLDPSEFPTPRDRSVELESLLGTVERELHKDSKERLDRNQRMELKRDVEHIRSWFANEFDAKGTRGVA